MNGGYIMIDWILNTLWNIKWILFLLFIFNELSRVLITYNKIQTFTQKIEEARSNISIVLNQKLEIINQFSTVVSQYDEHEKYLTIIQKLLRMQLMHYLIFMV